MDEDGFRDRGHRFSYLVACETARRIEADPALLDVAARHLAQFAQPDPHQRAGHALWSTLLAQGPAAIAQRLRERSPGGDYARETAPSFGALPPRLRAELLRRAHAAVPAR